MVCSERTVVPAITIAAENLLPTGLAVKPLA